MQQTLTTCLCCRRELTYNHFAHGHLICHTCDAQSANEAVISAIANLERIYDFRQSTTKGRKEARKLARLEQYNMAGGKRCGSCHAFLPVTAFGVCNPRVDGLQANCKACNKLQVQLLEQEGGRATWRTLRDTFRSQNDLKGTDKK